MAQDLSAGEHFARALLAKDWERVEDAVDPQIDFRGLTPSRQWEASTARDLVDDVLRQWLEPGDDVYEVLGISTEEVLGRGRVVYRFRVRSGGQDYVCEQTAYFDQEKDQIKKLRILCSGFLRNSG